MNQQTQVNQIKLRTRAERLKGETSKYIELPEQKNSFGHFFLRLDALVRNLAVVGGLVLVMIAVRNSRFAETQSVFSTIQESANMHWDESIGKLTFVNSLLPEEIREVWNETPAISVFAPVNGEVVHGWMKSEPYLLLKAETQDVRAAAEGEVMSVAHGMQEERILRLRHADGLETVYGNLMECFVEVGATVYAGDIIGKLWNDHPLAFEVRLDGRSVDPSSNMKPLLE